MSFLRKCLGALVTATCLRILNLKFKRKDVKWLFEALQRMLVGLREVLQRMLAGLREAIRPTRILAS